jgi:hypothetical protein
MKTSTKFTTIILLGMAIVYSSCQKAGIKAADATNTTTTTGTTTPTANTSTVGSQIALSLAKSLAGQYGGTNINNGIKAPNSLLLTRKGPSINGIYDLCGVTLDTTYNTTTLSHDTTNVLSGSFKFTYICASFGVNGYKVTDSITNAAANKSFYNTNTVVQQYLVTALDSTYLVVSMDGGVSETSHNSTLNPATGSTVAYHDLSSQYILNSVKVNYSTGVANIYVGNASYTTTQTDYDPTISATPVVTVYHGGIVYLGNNMVTMTMQINSFGPTYSYTINTLTGATTLNK